MKKHIDLFKGLKLEDLVTGDIYKLYACKNNEFSSAYDYKIEVEVNGQLCYLYDNLCGKYTVLCLADGSNYYTDNANVIGAYCFAVVA